jgi:hypothetical protein
MSVMRYESTASEARRLRLLGVALLGALGVRPELHRLGVVAVSGEGCRMYAVDGDRAERVLDLWHWLADNGARIGRRRPHAAALLVPTVDGAIVPTPYLEGVAEYDLNVFLVEPDGTMLRQVVACTVEDGRPRMGRARAGRRGPLDAVAALLAGLLDERPEPPAPLALVPPAWADELAA